MPSPAKVQPLRISKSTSADSSSPSKMALPRPLAEIGSTERRRNSPSYNQATRKMIVSSEASPYTENSFTKDSSPRNFWSNRDTMSPSRFDSENTPERSPSPSFGSPTRRASIEKLKQAGRVKTSNIFALETKATYDPANLPIVERPSANRPLSQQLANNSFARYDSARKENNPLGSPPRASDQHIPQTQSPSLHSVMQNGTSQKRPSYLSPTKSSLARTSQFGGSMLYDPESGTWSDDEDHKLTPRGLHRHNKSVTFREDPPVINEYEQPTPEPSVSAASDSREGSWDSDVYDEDYSFERGSSAEQHDDSFDEDLENADKTPVVLPEQWSRVSPEHARTSLVDADDDVFDPATNTDDSALRRSGSLASDGDSRPLPPIPGRTRERRNSALSAAAERASSAQRNLPSLPQRASCSKDDILNMSNKSTLTFDERMQLMGHQNVAGVPDNAGQFSGAPEELTLTNLDTGERLGLQVTDTEVEEDSFVSGLEEFANTPPRISRESILRKVRSRRFDLEDDQAEAVDDDSPARPSYAELAMMHPDDPIPSRETSQETTTGVVESLQPKLLHTSDIQIKEEPIDDDEFDMSAIPQAEHTPRPESALGEATRQSSVLRHNVDDTSDEEDSGSRYSTAEPEHESTVLHAQYESTPEPTDGRETLDEAMQLLTVKDYSGAESKHERVTSKDFVGLPSYLSTGDYDFGINKYLTPSPPQSNESTKQKIDITTAAPVLQCPTQPKSTPMKDLPRPTYDGADFSPPGTPESVIHRSEDEISAIDPDTAAQQTSERDSPVSPVEAERSIEIPERVASIKTGGKLKTRPSATPADLLMMAEQRRIVSAKHFVPDIPQASQAHPEECVEKARDQHRRDTTNENEQGDGSHQSQLDLSLDVPELEASNGLDLDEEFDRVIEKQKNGYLTRQSTKVVVASNRNFSNESNSTAKSNDTADGAPRAGSRAGAKNAANSPRKQSIDQHLKTEPWNGKVRRQSQRNFPVCPNEPAPPLPGQQSALGVVEEDFAAGTSSLEEDVGEDVERGRLFVKVVGMKNLDLPLPRNDRTYFQLTLDNGLHCVTTSDLEMGKTATIGQEFELVVLNDLEFQLTLTTKLPPPPKSTQSPVTLSSPSKKVGSKSAGISRFLTSPKKRAERERQEREAQEAEERRHREEVQRKRASVQPTAWDLLHELVNSADGSFARAYVNLRAHEKDCFGRPLVVDVPCYNEWALEKDSAVVNSVRSKRGNNSGPIRRPPYIIGSLELQLLYIPRPKDATEEDLPKSFSAAVREINKADKEATEKVEVTHEGHLSQQGGDCPFWRRRFFRLQGAKLTAYHEHTNQKRAVINLSKAARLVDDKSTLIADPTTASSSRAKRRKSAFAEEDEGYAYVEEGFRIRFANGETIDFYADSHAEKVLWMKKLAQVIGKPDTSTEQRTLKWTDLVHARERADLQGAGTSAATEVKDFGSQALTEKKPIPLRSAPTSPAKKIPVPGASRAPPVPEKNDKRPSTPPMSPRKGHRSRDAVKSMIF